jgi:hypothetical protein
MVVPIDAAFCLSIDTPINASFWGALADAGFSRVPVGIADSRMLSDLVPHTKAVRPRRQRTICTAHHSDL